MTAEIIPLRRSECTPRVAEPRQQPHLAHELIELRQDLISLSARAIVLLNAAAHRLGADRETPSA